MFVKDPPKEVDYDEELFEVDDPDEEPFPDDDEE